MRLASLLTNVVLFLALVNGLVFAGNPYFDSSDVTKQTSSYQCMEAVLLGESIATSSTKVIDVYNVPGFSSLTVATVQQSSGNVTVEYQAYDQAGNLVATASITEGTAFTALLDDAINAKLVFTNSVAVPITCTTNIVFSD